MSTSLSRFGETLGGLFSRKQGEAIAAAEVASLRSDRFRQEREGDWRRLDHIVRRIEAGRIRSLSDDDLAALPALYRMLVSSLSVARETTLDAATLRYLEGLAQRAWFVVHGPELGFRGWFRRFFAGGWSAAVRAIGPDIAIALVVMISGALIGWVLVSNNPDWFYTLMPPEPGDTRVPGASRAALYASLFGQSHQENLSIFAAQLFSHNAGISIMCFALGFAFGVPPILLLVQNTTEVGALLWLYHGQGLTLELIGWLSVHGTTELFALLLAGGAGIHIGRAMAFPGTCAMLDAAAAAGRRAATVMTGVVLMLVVAALLEGFARQLLDATAPRLTVGIGMLIWWLTYFYVYRGRMRAR
ncbi:stage II sporulation protein M [Novosphingobium sp.]|uniref:stage II sporulation protein M n=1 Tax=Novosphingobium sp. TaxID=1874826 RepID=UPI003D0B33F6